MARATAAASPLLTRSLRLLLATKRHKSHKRINQNSFCAFCAFLWLHLSQHFTSDDYPLNLRRPFANRAQLRVAPVFLRWIVFGVPVSAVHLDRFFANMNA